MINGSFQKHDLMKLTLILTLLFLTGFWFTNFALYFAKMGFTPQSVVSYYRGSEEQYRLPRTYQSMLEVTHGHLAMMPVVILLLTHLLIFAPYTNKTKVSFIVGGFSLAILNEGAGWLVRFVHPAFAWLKLVAFFSFQTILGFLIVALALFLTKGTTLTIKSRNKLNHVENKLDTQYH
ncbi:MAG: hypothetical protein D6813_06915 [Calditrichaeota bacterium]|nr:MAG: hypothetical protein D6813_06915 [Calditrichota bacterium]